jgi:hypothetical protein
LAAIWCWSPRSGSNADGGKCPLALVEAATVNAGVDLDLGRGTRLGCGPRGPGSQSTVSRPGLPRKLGSGSCSGFRRAAGGSNPSACKHG